MLLYHSSGISPSAPAAYTFPLACFAPAKHEADGRAALPFKWHFTARPTDCTFPLACFALAKQEADGRAAFIIQVAFHRPPPQPVHSP